MKFSYKIDRQGVKHLLKAARLLILALALALVCGAAKADTVGTYDVTGTLSSGGTLTGSFTFDYSAASGGINPITAVDITVDGVNFTGCPSGVLGTCNLYTALYGGADEGFTVAAPDGFLQLIWSAVDMSTTPALTLVSTTVCVDCNNSGYVTDWGAYYDNLVSGTATDPPGPVATPESSSFAMLLAGLLGLGAFMAWRARQGKAAGQLA